MPLFPFLYASIPEGPFLYAPIPGLPYHMCVYKFIRTYFPNHRHVYWSTHISLFPNIPTPFTYSHGASIISGHIRKLKYS